MKALLLALLLFLSWPTGCYSADVPPLTGRVNDSAGILTPEARQRLETLLTSFERAESTQIAVLTVPSLEGEPIEQFGIKVADAWRIGRSAIDNGIILIISRQDRKIRIEVGKGLEGSLTDLICGRIIRNEIAPRFKAGDSDGGVLAGVTAIMSAVKGEYSPAPPRALRGSHKTAPPVFTLLICAAVICIFISTASRFLAGCAGSVLVPLAVYLSFASLSLFMLLGLAGAGFIMGLLIGSLFSSGGQGGGGMFGGGMFGGGPWIGGSSGGGSFNDGGFSGEGGGFGGGGASGDW